MFDPVNPKQSLPDMEEGILQYWREEDVFKRSVSRRKSTSGDVPDNPGDPTESPEGDTFSFYDGPPFATGLPHYGHLLAGTIKDVIPRYQTMRGKMVQRRFGWDCHGLPIENLIEKEHDIKDKNEIEKMGVSAFNNLCRSSVQRYTEEWRKTVERMGRWVDMDWDYRTMDPDYMESIWWVFSQLNERNLIYEGRKSMHVCPRCVTPLSNFEVTQGYKEVTDWTSYTTYPLTDDPKTALIAWTTTTWTLPGNLLLAVGPSITYAKVRTEGSDLTYIVAEQLVKNVFAKQEHEVVGTLKAKDLAGKTYEPLFPYFVDEYKPQGAFRIVEADFVTTEDGTGIVHIAPGFGTDDYELGRKEEVGVLSHVTMNGKLIDEVTDFAGMDVKPIDDPTKTDKKIAEKLKEMGRLFKAESYKHTYPHCWRCDSPLINYSTSSWFVAVEKIKDTMLKANSRTDWVPDHVRDKRFGKWLENARDWAISRNRYWGTPLPIWRTEDGEDMTVIGSRDELMRHCGERFTKVTALRHAESEGNLIPIYQGQEPGTDLTDKGKQQAAQAGEWLRTKEVDVIYCSPLARTQQTAKAIADATGAELIVDDRLREVNFGEYEGKTVDFSDLTFIKDRRAHKIESGKPESIYHFEGMESWDSVYERIENFMNETLPKHKGQHVVVVTHADPMMNVEHFFTKEDPVKLSHRPYPQKAVPNLYFWDNETKQQMDLHKDTVDEITWTNRDGKEMKRIPEVLDCWFESGSMPYAQEHYPFEMAHADANRPPAFPADFIAEGMDQTRGWFYTLTVLGAALFETSPFEHCVVNGIVLAEDGKKMSKRLKNYPEPMAVVEALGADAVRFTLMSSPAVRGEDLKFSKRLVEETVRSVLLPLWNTYSFFVTYANAAGFEPTDSRKHSTHPLDVWIRAEVQDLVNRMTTQLDSYDLSATCNELHETIDALTNWYVRLSRRRFAGKGVLDAAPDALGEAEEQDRHDALTTLYDVLITLSQVLAPFCPYITDAMYLNLVPEDHGSVHLTDWPLTRELSTKEKSLIEKTSVMRIIVSLGNTIRATNKIKIRQPLQSTTIVLPDKYNSDKLFVKEDLDLLRQELNVKEVNFTKEVSDLAIKMAIVDARKVGPRLGQRIQKVIAAGKEGAFTEESDRILILDEVLSPDEVEIVYKSKEDMEEKRNRSVVADKGVVVSMNTTMNRVLEMEGIARDIIRAIQKIRKEAGYEFTDTVKLVLKGADDVLSEHKDLILSETKSVLQENNGEQYDAMAGGIKVQIKIEKI